MEMSMQNPELWSFIVQIGIVSILLLLSNLLRTKVRLIKKSLIPTAVLAGFILLLFRSTEIINLGADFLETLTYHGIGIGFIALSLRVKEKTIETENGEAILAIKNGAIVVGAYLVQAIGGLIITIGLSLTFMPDMFRAAGMLLPMAYGQGPGQANNIGATYESLGFIGGRSFGLALAAAGFLCACIVGVVYLNVLKRKKGYNIRNFKQDTASLTTDVFQSKEEIPIAESVDKFSVQMGLVLAVYALTFFIMYLSTTAISTYLPSMEKLVNPLIIGFNFMFGSGLALGVSAIYANLRKKKLVKYQYQNNYLLNRISGYAFDLMIIAGIGGIEMGDLEGLWIPFIILSITGGITTFFYLKWVCNFVYKGYEEQGFISTYGTLTGTISSGILLLREIDPLYESPAANNLITGAGTAIILALPILIIVGIAPQTPYMPFVVILLASVYFALLMLTVFKLGKKK